MKTWVMLGLIPIMALADHEGVVRRTVEPPIDAIQSAQRCRSEVARVESGFTAEYVQLIASAQNLMTLERAYLIVGCEQRASAVAKAWDMSSDEIKQMIRAAYFRGKLQATFAQFQSDMAKAKEICEQIDQKRVSPIEGNRKNSTYLSNGPLTKSLDKAHFYVEEIEPLKKFTPFFRAFIEAFETRASVVGAEACAEKGKRAFQVNQ